MSSPGITFLGADSPYQDAKFVVLGVPFDLTTTFRPGARSAPTAVREASYHSESYMYETARMTVSTSAGSGSMIWLTSGFPRRGTSGLGIP